MDTKMSDGEIIDKLIGRLAVFNNDFYNCPSDIFKVEQPSECLLECEDCLKQAVLKLRGGD